MKLPKLHIGDLTANIPIIQGGMGIGVSLSGLAGAVAREGGIGVISAAQVGFNEPDFRTNTVKANIRALKEQIHKAREKAKNGIIGINIMWRGQHYEDYARTAAESGADIIFSGAGLPADLPVCVEGTNTKIAPIIGSPKAARVILKLWAKHHNRTADLVVIEGPKAGGHLGYTREQVKMHEGDGYEKEILEILGVVKEFEEKFNKKIPVVFGGGIFDKKISSITCPWACPACRWPPVSSLRKNAMQQRPSRICMSRQKPLMLPLCRVLSTCPAAPCSILLSVPSVREGFL